MNMVSVNINLPLPVFSPFRFSRRLRLPFLPRCVLAMNKGFRVHTIGTDAKDGR